MPFSKYSGEYTSIHFIRFWLTNGDYISYKKKAATPSNPAAIAPKLTTLAAAAPVKGVGVEVETPVELLVLVLLVELLTGRKLAHVRRVVL